MRVTTPFGFLLFLVAIQSFRLIDQILPVSRNLTKPLKVATRLREEIIDIMQY
ncbi:hypothetical protein KCTCHS21_29730 [Cohnella abietis]|uniref:Uncharacterized protein n=1 Tax=Cohnella abietis TaxID=2507935 RepID=A0A3T1D676_9BACL|nr:hypothetical protein KCTCHS21_29730 [Cohnella abietis]